MFGIKGEKMKIKILIVMSFLILVGLGVLIFSGCKSHVKYIKHTGIIQCDIAIMTSIIKSKEGYSAFEVDKYISACFTAIKKHECKLQNFGESPISYDNKDLKYVSFLACLNS